MSVLDAWCVYKVGKSLKGVNTNLNVKINSLDDFLQS